MKDGVRQVPLVNTPHPFYELHILISIFAFFLFNLLFLGSYHSVNPRARRAITKRLPGEYWSATYSDTSLFPILLL